jgi:pimeloyl-ACP methyl ester carboxylesterase
MSLDTDTSTDIPNTSSGAQMAAVNDIEVCYETFGSFSDPAVLLVMGFTAQMTAWDVEFCETLAAVGRFVIRFDNRDCGLTTKFDGQTVDMAALMLAQAGACEAPPAPYSLSEMSSDGFALLTHLGIDQAHIVGASMGGMIVQTMAIEHPERVLSMTSMWSATGNPDYFESAPEAMVALLSPPPEDRDAFVDSAERGAIWGSPKYFDLEVARRKAGETFDRSFYPEGASRQMAAIGASGDREAGLAELTVPTLVIHGMADTLIMPSGGQRTAEVVPGANLMLFSDMGHDLPLPLMPLVVDAIKSHTTHTL